LIEEDVQDLVKTAVISEARTP